MLSSSMSRAESNIGSSDGVPPSELVTETDDAPISNRNSERARASRDDDDNDDADGASLLSTSSSDVGEEAAVRPRKVTR